MKTYYIAKSEHYDSVYYDQDPVCVTIEEIRSLANGWGEDFDETFELFREADDDDIAEWGISDF